MATASVLPPLTEAIIHAVCRLVDDHGSPREPSHSQVGFVIEQAGLSEVDHAENPRPAGKERRLRAILTWAHVNDIERGQALLLHLFPLLRGCSGFMEGPHFVGHNQLLSAQEAFAAEGWELTAIGDLHPMLLEITGGQEAEHVLRGYVRRLRRNPDDTPLIVGTSKDLLEATAKFVLFERYGEDREGNFEGLIGQAFTALDLATRHHPRAVSEPIRREFERHLYDLALDINRLRNREGTGKGRAFLPSVTTAEARAACQAMALISDYLLDALRRQ